MKKINTIKLSNKNTDMCFNDCTMSEMQQNKCACLNTDIGTQKDLEHSN